MTRYLRLLSGLAFIICCSVLLSGCLAGASFPKEQCKLGDVPAEVQRALGDAWTGDLSRAWLCNCEVVEWPIKARLDAEGNPMPKPAGWVLLECDGRLLPIFVRADDVELPR